MDANDPEAVSGAIQTPTENGKRGLSPGLGLALLLAFLLLAVGARAVFVSPPAEQDGNHFAILSEALRVYEETSGAPLSLEQEDITRAVYLMTLSAVEGPDSVVLQTFRRVAAEVEESDERVPAAVPAGLEDVWRAAEILRRDYPDASPADMTQAARRGLFVRGQDPALTFLDPGEYEDVQEFFSQSTYEGIGARVGTIDGVNVITDVFLGSPAELAGLRPGDSIVAVDGVPTQELAVDELVEIVKGASGTEVALEIRRPWDGPDPAFTVTIVRETVPTSLEARILGEDTGRPPVGYIMIERFYAGTGEDFRAALTTLLDRDIRALILDLRFNPGGSLSGAMDVVSEFVPEGLVMREITHDGNRIEWSVTEDGQAFDIPLAVLVNGYSASASEVVAGALQDHGRAAVYGSPTYGKGSVQAFQELSDGSALYVTVSRWYTPAGRQIQDTGIHPDYLVILRLDDYLEGRDTILATAYADLTDALGATLFGAA